MFSGNGVAAGGGVAPGEGVAAVRDRVAFGDDMVPVCSGYIQQFIYRKRKVSQLFVFIYIYIYIYIYMFVYWE